MTPITISSSFNSYLITVDKWRGSKNPFLFHDLLWIEQVFLFWTCCKQLSQHMPWLLIQVYTETTFRYFQEKKRLFLWLSTSASCSHAINWNYFLCLPSYNFVTASQIVSKKISLKAGEDYTWSKDRVRMWWVGLEAIVGYFLSHEQYF